MEYIDETLYIRVKEKKNEDTVKLFDFLKNKKKVQVT